jgi:hypothetical protein
MLKSEKALLSLKENYQSYQSSEWRRFDGEGSDASAPRSPRAGALAAVRFRSR